MRGPGDRPAGERLEPERHVDDAAREAHPADGQREERSVVGVGAADLAVVGVVERQGDDVIGEVPDVVLGLAVDIEARAPTDGDRGMTREHREVATRTDGEVVQRTDREPGFDLHGALRRVEVEDPIEMAHRDRRPAVAHARERVAQTGATDRARAGRIE